MKNRSFGILKFPTFSEHFLKRRYEHYVKSEREYEEAIIRALAEGEVYYLKDKAEREYLVFFHSVTRWVVIVRESEIIATAFVLYDNFATIEDYLSKKGFYLYINMSDEASDKTHSAIVERIRSSLKVL